MARQYWLVKSEPEAYSIDDLERDGKTFWDGIRNYSARNLMRDKMKVGDRVLYYHSNANPPGVVGIAEVVTASYPDHTQFDPESRYHDPKATEEKPRWFMVDIGFV
ncbi:MAG: EVE domain-containing protein, partial [Gemmatimonadota bacterium]|nr:EVE domain-containing protein [Gemmatimonadota bacterium]